MKTTKLTILILAICLLPVSAFGKSGFYTKFKKQYPDATRLNSVGCVLCHSDGENFSLNGYGLDLQKSYHSNGKVLDFTLIEKLESDGDGYINIDEIRADKLPGDKNDHPEQRPE